MADELIYFATEYEITEEQKRSAGISLATAALRCIGAGVSETEVKSDLKEVLDALEITTKKELDK